MAQVPSHTHTFTFDIPSASSAEVAAGTSDSKAVTPLALAGAGETFLGLLGGGAAGIDVFQSVTPADARTVLELGTASTSATGDFATASQGALADTAVQPADLATVATTGQYTDIVGTPTLGTASAQDSTAFATSAQGLLADSAVQPGDGEAIPAGGTTGQVLAKASATDGDTFWTAAGTGDIISTNNGSDFEDKSEVRANLAIGLTTSEIASRNIPATILSFVTSGYSVAGDGGAASWKEISDPGTVEPWHRQSADGRFWQLTEDVVKPQMFGGATRDAIQDALNSPAPATEIRDNLTYTVAETITVPSGKTFRQIGLAVLKADISLTSPVVGLASASDRSRLKGLIVDGSKTDGRTSGGNIQTLGTGHGDIEVEDCLSYNSPVSGMVLSETANLKVRDNITNSNGLAGIQILDVEDLTASGNHSRLNGNAGISWTANNASIVNNVCRDNGQGPEVADGLTGYGLTTGFITIAGNILVGNLHNGMHVGGSNLTIGVNVAVGNGLHGIYVETGNEGAARVCLSLAGNTANDNAQCGIRVLGYSIIALGANTARANGEENISLVDCASGTISGGTSNGSTSSYGVRLLRCDEIDISGLQSRSNASHGLVLQDSTDCTVNGGSYNQNSGTGIVEVGTVSGNTIDGPKTRNNTGGGISRISAKVRNIDVNMPPNITAAASVSLPEELKVFQLDGATTVGGFTNGWLDREVTIRGGSGSRTLTNSGSLLLAGAVDFAMGQHDVLTLVCLDTAGTIWLETGRSER